MIFHEIAVEPDVIRTLRDLQCVLGLSGFGKGRLIAEFPQKRPAGEATNSGTWVERVLESVGTNEIGKVAKARELLITERKKILRSKRPFLHDASWIENARTENERLPFATMIVDRPEQALECDLDDILGERSPPCLQDDQHVRSVPKQPEQLAEYLLPMLRCASALRFVDPHYLWLDRNRGWLNLSEAHAQVAGAIARRMSARDTDRVPRIVEFHMLSVTDDPQADLRLFAREMAAYLPSRWKATAFAWRQLESGKRFHARYILTDVGGVGSDYGLDAGRSDGDETDIYLLTEAMRTKRTVDFSVDGDAFKLAAGPFEFSGILR